MITEELKELMLEAIRHERPQEIEKVCLEIWNQPFFYQIDKAQALTISYNPTDKGARENYKKTLDKYKRGELNSQTDAPQIYDILYKFKIESQWRKYYNLILGKLGIKVENIAHMDASIFPYKTFSDYLAYKSQDDTSRYLLDAIELLGDRLKYILIDGAKNESILDYFEPDYTLIHQTQLPINRGQPHDLRIYQSKYFNTKLIYYKCFLYGQTCPSNEYVEKMAEYILKHV